MAENSPGWSLERRKQSSVIVGCLETGQTLEAIASLLDIVQSSRGPSGRLKLLHNGQGGHVTCTSSSTRILSSLNCRTPILLIVISAVKLHLDKFKDSGLLYATLTLDLIHRTLKSPIIPRRLLMEIYKRLGNELVQYLDGPSSVKFDIDISKVDHMLNFIRSLLISKPGCGLRKTEQDHIGMLLLKTFVTILPGDEDSKMLDISSSVQYVKLEGRPASESNLIKGVLYPMSVIPEHKIQAFSHLKNEDGKIKVVLFSASLAGDQTNALDVTYECNEDIDVDEAVLEYMKSCLIQHVQNDVRVLICQKVVHPSITAWLRENEILVLDRLGLKLIQAVKNLTGGFLHSNLNQVSSNEEHYGWLDSISHTVLNRQSYLHLESENKQQCTLVICNRTEEALNELKVVCEQSLGMLQDMVFSPTVLAGGGCWLVHVAKYIQHLVTSRSESLRSELQCTGHQLDHATDTFTKCLLSLATGLYTTTTDAEFMMDTEHGHLWSQQVEDLKMSKRSCQCGAVSYNTQKDKPPHLMPLDHGASWESSLGRDSRLNEPTLIDSFLPIRNALSGAVNMAVTILSIHTTITHNV